MRSRVGGVWSTPWLHRRGRLLWAGTDDGLIHVARDGGSNWTDVTPPSLGPWAKVSIMEASCFDRDTAYAAINTLRLGDLQPHVLRTIGSVLINRFRRRPGCFVRMGSALPRPSDTILRVPDFGRGSSDCRRVDRSLVLLPRTLLAHPTSSSRHSPEERRAGSPDLPGLPPMRRCLWSPE